ncbi:MAG TPA: FAD-dependent oxidoreductase, partial [Pseudolabrys sp.]|nr:FAD-dependent oxidoreductase [Pseudolabrys sp.]
MADHNVDLFVIGAGSGGVRAARVASSYGARVMIAEEYRVGGTCVIRGCVPKKLLVYASRFSDEFEDAAGYGWSLARQEFDWATLIANKDREIARLEAAYTTTLERYNVKIAKSRAVLEDEHTVRLTTGARVRAQTILIATGARPHHGTPIAGENHVISSNEAFHLSKLPKRILIQGGGYIAVEFAGIFNGLGCDVTLVYRGEKILRGFDEDVREHLMRELGLRGIRILTRKIVKAVEKVDHGFDVCLSDNEQIMVDLAMFATGRRPNTERLGLKNVGVKISERNAIMVDAYSRTSVPNIYAVGDVTDRVNLTPVAIREGHA